MIKYMGELKYGHIFNLDDNNEIISICTKERYTPTDIVFNNSLK